MSGTDAQAAVERHFMLFNTAVRTGDWATFAGCYSEDASVHFHGVPVPAMRGRQGIADGYRANPPDDTITVLDRTVAPAADGDQVAVRFTWDADPGGEPGLIRLLLRDGLVVEKHIYLVVPEAADR